MIAAGPAFWSWADWGPFFAILSALGIPFLALTSHKLGQYDRRKAQCSTSPCDKRDNHKGKHAHYAFDPTNQSLTKVRTWWP